LSQEKSGSKDKLNVTGNNLGEPATEPPFKGKNNTGETAVLDNKGHLSWQQTAGKRFPTDSTPFFG
jgi:hypothetical protein